jgi:hypothetical protein
MRVDIKTGYQHPQQPFLSQTTTLSLGDKVFRPMEDGHGLPIGPRGQELFTISRKEAILLKHTTAQSTKASSKR